MIREKVLLVFINFENFKNNTTKKQRYHKTINENVEELKNLTISAGADVEEILCHKQDKPNPKYFISTGKLEEIKNIVDNKEIELVIFDNEITPTQQRNLQLKLDTKVLDRTALILDIFAQRAHSREGKLQVELAQLNYLLPRLIGKGIELSRLGGGIGTRGPGETKLEVDRRKIRKRISLLEKKIYQISVQRDTQRKKREEKNIFQIALVGYTNSGKSTLLNATTDSDAYVEDRLFSTLDSTTRKLKIYPNSEVLISDTVGFIEKLPHQLIASFKSTLEEVKRSDLLLLVVDISNTDFENNIYSVKEVLKEIGVWQKPVVLVFNKIDKLSSGELNSLKIKYKNSVFISALKRRGLPELYLRIKKIIERHYLNIIVKIPYNENKIMSFIYSNCQVLRRRDLEDSAILNLNVNSKYCSILSRYIYRGRESREAYIG
ncbi:MAG: GTPase HflX [Candidatus Hydromicrobium americanum]|nr:MAG: GTPase HflX [Candidatus Hydromicrobium americanum]